MKNLRYLFTITLAFMIINEASAKTRYSTFFDTTVVKQADSVFFSDFPFATYSNVAKEQPLSYLVNDVEFIDKSKLDPNRFLDSFYVYLMPTKAANKVELAHLQQVIKIGEGLMNLDGISLRAFPAFGDLLLQDVTSILEDGLKQEIFNARDFEISYMITRLRENQFFVQVPMSDWDKGWSHLNDGNYKYLIRKVRLKQPVLFYGGLATVTAVLLFFSLLMVKKLNR